MDILVRDAKLEDAERILDIYAYDYFLLGTL